MKVEIYVRVSSDRQAKKELSILHLLNQLAVKFMSKVFYTTVQLKDDDEVLYQEVVVTEWE